MAERYPEAELVLDDELLYEEAPRRSMLRRSDERPEDIVREGEVLAGKYRVERIPGRNGLGVVVQVRHLELGQEVTLKFLVPEACAYPEFVQRFVREARSAVRIQGEHVARVTDVGRLESGAPYMVREFLRGPDLAEVLKVRGPLPVAEAVDYVIQACEGVAEGHALGVVHRNLRPTSLVVVRRSDGTALVKVFDFAASESLHVNPFTERAVSLVGTSAIMASLPYLAPEQIRDPHDVDFRADVYSIGAVLFELLSGTPVYSADAAPALLAQVAADAAPGLRTLRADVPGELDHIVLRCLAKNRALRYASIADLVLELAPFGSPETTSSVERIVRLGKRTSKLSEPASSRPASVTAPLASVAPLSQPAPARGRSGTLPPLEATASKRPSVHEEITTINPYSAYAAPVVIHPEHARYEPQRPEPLRTEAFRAEPPPPSGRRTPLPPPLRTSAPPPLREPVKTLPLPSPPPVPAPNHFSEPPARRVDPTSLPPALPRSSMSGVSRSWAVADEPAPPLFTKGRLLAVGGAAACAALVAILALRGSPAPPVAAAAAAPPAAVARPPVVAPAPAPPPPEPVVAPASAEVAVVPPPAPVAQPAPTPPAAVALPAPVVKPAPVAAAAPAPGPLVVAPKAQAAVRRPLRDEAPTESRKPASAADQKLASNRSAGAGDLFDDPR